MKKIILIDGNNIMNRAFFGLPDLTTSRGLHTNAIIGFLNILFRFLDDEKPDYCAVAFDKGPHTFRHQQFKEYKAQRKPADPNMLSQFPLLYEILDKMHILRMDSDDFEADDLIGTVARRARDNGIETIIVSGDRDLLQLVDKNITLVFPVTSSGKTTVKRYAPDDFCAEYGLEAPSQIIDLKAIMGDSSDNYKGVAGVGEKGALELIKSYKSLDGVYDHIDEIKGKLQEKLITDKENAYFCRFLATIKTDCDYDFDFADACLGNIFNPESYGMVKELEFKSLLPRFKDVDISGAAAKVQLLHSEAAIIADLFEAENAFSKIAAEKPCNIGFSYVSVENDKGTYNSIYAVSLKSSKHAFTFICEGFLTESTLIERISDILRKGFTLISLDIKPIAEKFPMSVRKKIHDLSLAAYLIHPGMNTYNHVDIARDHLSMCASEEKEVLGKTPLCDAIMDNSFTGELRSKAASLLSDAAFVAFSAFEPMMRLLKEESMMYLYEDVELPLAFVLREMENNGVLVDREALYTYGRDLSSKITLLEDEIYGLAGERFNINSPKQLGELLFEKLGIPGGKKTKTGYSTAADVLESLKDEYPIVHRILEYRTYSKLKSTYADGLSDYIASDRRIHTKFNQKVTTTGRLSSTEPNLQNIPIRSEYGREIRRMFIPERGFSFVDVDYSQIELRILAHMSGDSKLIDAYANGRDIHRSTASAVFKVPFDEVTDQQRSAAKAVNFGIIYGMSSFGLGQEISVSKKEAEKYIEDYFSTYPKIKEYLDGLVEDARQKGYSTTMFNRRRPLPDINAKNFLVRSAAERTAMNSPIQGTAADIMKIALVNVYNALGEELKEAKLLLQVHDELLLEVPSESAQKCADIVKREMEKAVDLKVKLISEAKTGANWDESH